MELNQVCYRNIHLEESWTLKSYESIGGYKVWRKILAEKTPPEEIIEELSSGKLSQIAERSGRAQDKDDGGGLESLRRDGYM